jgi:hypothetical protein
MTGRADQVPELAQRLRELADFATAGGAPEQWLEKTFALLVSAYLDKVDPRRRRSLERAAVLRRKIAAGATPEQLAARHGHSVSWIRRLCALPETDLTSRPLSGVEPRPIDLRRKTRV